MADKEVAARQSEETLGEAASRCHEQRDLTTHLTATATALDEQRRPKTDAGRGK
jgi:hypothetical protein